MSQCETAYYYAPLDRIYLIHKYQNRLWATEYERYEMEHDGRKIKDWLGLFRFRVHMQKWNYSLKHGALVKLGRL